jgi:hypothetical protein
MAYKIRKEPKKVQYVVVPSTEAVHKGRWQYKKHPPFIPIFSKDRKEAQTIAKKCSEHFGFKWVVA